MAFTDGTMSPADVAAVTGNNDGFGGNNAWWIILLFLICGNGWGNGYGGNAGSPAFIDASLQRGFDQNAIMNGITGINNGISGLQQSLCNGFAGVSNGFAQVEIGANARQMADMNRMFDLQSQLAQCCCENRLATANLQSTIISENCADRQVVSDGIRDLIVAYNSGTQRILDQMCNDKIDMKNEKIADLERQLTMMNLAASQTAQTADLKQDNTYQTLALIQRLDPNPIPAYVVANPNAPATTTTTAA